MKIYQLIYGLLLSCLSLQAETFIYDIVIYGGSSAGVMAAVQAGRMGKKVALVTPERHIGGATSNGLSAVDCLRHSLIGGLSYEFFYRVGQYYQDESAWKYETRHLMRDQQGLQDPSDPTMWLVEPHVAEKIFNGMIVEANADVFYNERLNRETGVIVWEGSIRQIQMHSGDVFQGKVFIDATYEGDLMAAAHVSYILGRESNLLYGELSNGIRTKFIDPKIDPFKIKGDPSSGCLPRICPDLGGKEGEGDNKVQAYNYRMCLTDVPENRLMIQKPLHYNEEDYEILFRASECGMSKEYFFKLSRIPNRKIDANNTHPISTDYIGMSWAWPEATDEERKEMAKEHEQWQKGFVWTLQNHPRIREDIRDYYSPWGLPIDEFSGNGNWPYELYVREGRRMVSAYVITENTFLGKEQITDPVALVHYHMDSHAVKYYVSSEGTLAVDGGFYFKLKNPSPISYQALVPKREECQNLIVPVCLSASHLAYGAIRMEPQFMMLGQSAAAAASLAIDLEVAVQDVPYDQLSLQLIKDKQILQ